MNIFINATATKTGGALTILYEIIEVMMKKDANVYVFTSVPDKLNEYKENITIVNCRNINKIYKRIFWDMYSLKKWSSKNKIYADIVISLQNTGFRYFKNVKKLVYVHQSIPYYDYNWNPFKKDERVLWFYKNIYIKAMELSWDKRTELIVQTHWMKKLVNKKSKIKLENIRVVRPKIYIEDINDYIKNNDEFIIFYPASALKYKNHIDIINAVIRIKNINQDIFEKIQIIFTITKMEGEKLFFNQLEDKLILNKIKFLGCIEKNDVYKNYKNSDLIIFSSCMETIGLPILEAMKFRKPILVRNSIYSEESLSDYKDSYIYNNIEELSKKIIYIYENKKFNRKIYKKFEYDLLENIFL